MHSDYSTMAIELVDQIIAVDDVEVKEGSCPCGIQAKRPAGREWGRVIIDPENCSISKTLSLLRHPCFVVIFNRF
jgi:hypothetical protein